MRPLPALLLLVLSSLTFAQTDHIVVEDYVRKQFNINNNWVYIEDAAKTPDKIKPSTPHDSINLPHTWNAFDVVDAQPGYRRSASWYQKDLYIPLNELGKQYTLYFEGCNVSTKVYVNGKWAGNHVGGYVGFKIDITAHVIEGEHNVIQVRVDNSINKDIIPSQKADFFIYGGIVRDVWLEITNKQHLIRTNSYITPRKERIGPDRMITFHAAFKPTQLGKFKVEWELLNKKGKTAIKVSEHVECNNIGIMEQTTYSGFVPRRWSPNSPATYPMTTRLYYNNELIDEYNSTVGFKEVAFTEEGAFTINKKQLLLRGTHRHEEHAGTGAAMTNAMHRKEMIQIKGMGANFLKLAHHPHDPIIYHLADSLGILLWDEMPWYHGGIGEKQWIENTDELLTEQINQNSCHPSILLWSLGNEPHFDPDFDQGGDTTAIIDYLKHLNKLAKRLDPTRMTACRNFDPAQNIVDIYSPAIWSGWHQGGFKDYEGELIEARKKYPQLIHMEYGGASHVGRHESLNMKFPVIEKKPDEEPIMAVSETGNWTETYMNELYDWYLSISEGMPHFAGNAQVAFEDYGSPLRSDNPIPYVNQCGLVDRDGNPKDAYYIFKSYWNDQPFVYIQSHSLDFLSGGPEDKHSFNVWSNCDEVSLNVNGKNLNRKQRMRGRYPAHGLNFDVILKSGNNTIIATGYNRGKEISKDTISIEYLLGTIGDPTKIVLESQKLETGKFLVTAIMTDQSGARCGHYNERVYFSLNGEGKLIENLGTPNGSSVIEFSNGKASIQVFVQEGEQATIEAGNETFKGSYITIPEK